MNNEAYKLAMKTPEAIYDKKKLMDDAVEQTKKTYTYKRGKSRSGPRSVGLCMAADVRDEEIKQREEKLKSLGGGTLNRGH